MPRNPNASGEPRHLVHPPPAAHGDGWGESESHYPLSRRRHRFARPGSALVLDLRARARVALAQPRPTEEAYAAPTVGISAILHTEAATASGRWNQAADRRVTATFSKTIKQTINKPPNNASTSVTVHFSVKHAVTA